MAETELTAEEASALDGTTDSETDFTYHSPGDANYYTEGQRQRHRLLTLGKAVGNRFRVYKDGGVTFGVRPGKLPHGGATLAYAGSTGNALTDDQTNYVYLYVSGGALVLAVSTSGFPDPSATPHLPLATIGVASGAFGYSDITDCRQVGAFSLVSAAGADDLNTLVGGSNADGLHTHGSAGLESGAVTATKIQNGAVTDAKLASAICKRAAINAWGAVDFTGRPADDELLTIDGRKYEIDTDGDFPQSGGDVQVDLSGNGTVDEDITDIAAAINGDGSATVSAVADTANDILWLYAKAAGAAGNGITVAETLSNATARASTLRDGADAAVGAVVNIRHTITANDAAEGHFRIETGLSSIDGVYLSFEETGTEAASGITVGVSGGTLTLDEGPTTWADGDVLNILLIGTE